MVMKPVIARTLGFGEVAACKAGRAATAAQASADRIRFG